LHALEQCRQQKSIGKSLDAKVEIQVHALAFHAIKKYEAVLEEIFNVSKVLVSLVGEDYPDGADEKKIAEFLMSQDARLGLEIGVLVDPADGTKCDRCWRYTEDVGHDAKYPTVCLRCAEALTEIGFAPYTKETE
jgi:isoleucyl-tRNA synthetase